ncbi:MAG: cytochrome c biogenesis protein CcsA [Coprobacter sp.]|nr:cytochrome c biogenesis protein CcsA [Coprobacter sp.]
MATIVEKCYGHEFATTTFYTSWWGITLWVILGVSATGYMCCCRLWKRIFTFGIHLAFLLILSGALVTHISGTQGSVHLRKNIPVRSYVDDVGECRQFPFEIILKDFMVEYYPASSTPMDYISLLSVNIDDKRVDAKVSMNNILRLDGYRFYQSGYDRDEAGTTLAISYDPYGIAITYLGYAILLISLIAFFFHKDSVFRTLLRRVSIRRGIAMMFLLIPAYTYAIPATPQTLPRSVAAEFGDLYIYYNGRVAPLQTFANDFTSKLYGKSSYKGLTAEQVLTGWIFYYDEWKNEPVIKIKGAEARRVLGIDGKYARLTDFLDIYGYKLESSLSRESDISLRRQFVEADEKFNLVSMLCTGSLLKIYPYISPTDSTFSWFSPIDRLPAEMSENEWAFVGGSMNYIAEQLAMKNYKEVAEIVAKIGKYQHDKVSRLSLSDARFRAEKIYNSYSCNRYVAISAFVIGILFFILGCRLVLRHTRQSRVVTFGAGLCAGILLIYLSAQIVLRGYIGGHIPLSNGFETMQFMAWCSVLLAILVRKRFYMAYPFGFILCGLSLLVAMMGEANPQITYLMPVLQSPLLCVHVVIIMLAYALLAFIMFNGLMAIVLHYSKKSHENDEEYLCEVSRLMLYPAVFLLVAGIFVGAIWANVSWGRYWGWDPKEVWALITMLVYAVALHSRSIALFRRPLFFHIYMVLAFFTVLFTYFGVNFFLGGLHSYA